MALKKIKKMFFLFYILFNNVFASSCLVNKTSSTVPSLLSTSLVLFKEQQSALVPYIAEEKNIIKSKQPHLMICDMAYNEVFFKKFYLMQNQLDWLELKSSKYLYNKIDQEYRLFKRSRFYDLLEDGVSSLVYKNTFMEGASCIDPMLAFVLSIIDFMNSDRKLIYKEYQRYKQSKNTYGENQNKQFFSRLIYRFLVGCFFVKIINSFYFYNNNLESFIDNQEWKNFIENNFHEGSMDNFHELIMYSIAEGVICNKEISPVYEQFVFQINLFLKDLILRIRPIIISSKQDEIKSFSNVLEKLFIFNIQHYLFLKELSFNKKKIMRKVQKKRLLHKNFLNLMYPKTVLDFAVLSYIQKNNFLVSVFLAFIKKNFNKYRQLVNSKDSIKKIEFLPFLMNDNSLQFYNHNNEIKEGPFYVEHKKTSLL